MSLSTKYYSDASEWAGETFIKWIGAPVRSLSQIPNSYSEINRETDKDKEYYTKIAKDLYSYYGMISDPRFEYCGDNIVKIKDEWYPEFLKWAKEKGLDYNEKQPSMYLSMTIWGFSRRVTLENKKYLIDKRSARDDYDFYTI